MKQGFTTGVGNRARQSGRHGKTDLISRREEYLRHCGFKRDPFRLPVAEQEYGFRDRQGKPLPPQQKLDDAPGSIFTPRAYYVDPLYKSRREGSVFDQLREPGHAFVFGKPGAGKSTLRFALEAHMRGRPDGATLAVTHEVEEELRDYKPEGAETSAWPNTSTHPTRDVHLRLLARSLTVDLFIQIVEQFSFRDDDNMPTDEQSEQLVDLILRLDKRRLEAIKKVIDRLMIHGKQEPSPVWGSAGVWRRLDRPVVVAVTRSSRLTAWLAKVNPERRATPADSMSGATLWAHALETARLWGFHRVFVLIDGLDALRPDRAYMRGRINPLLRHLPEFGARGVSLKFFLPVELDGDESKILPHNGVALGSWRTIRLEWKPGRLQALIEERYRAGGARRNGLSDLVVSSLTGKIDAQLIKEAKGSPRRLVTLVDELIEAHVERGQIEEPITEAEWKKAIEATNKRLSAEIHSKPGLPNRAVKSLRETTNRVVSFARPISRRRRHV